ncbi:hypothetical protein [Nocardia sp. R7R-8]|uniref:hypothetical protein n=1 Tax=Nocardia sp. R7R-8 TaxID=3459304 RepID=UPI00403DD58A
MIDPTAGHPTPRATGIRRAACGAETDATTFSAGLTFDNAVPGSALSVTVSPATR